MVTSKASSRPATKCSSKLSYRSLSDSHDSGDREALVSAVRSSFLDVDLRVWQSWRESCGIPKCARSCSKLSALRLWILARANGKLNKNEIQAKLAEWLKESPDSVEEWLGSVASPITAPVRSTPHVVGAIKALAPDLVISSRARLYYWFERAGLCYSAKSEYTTGQLKRVIRQARISQSRGQKKKDAGPYPFGNNIEWIRPIDMEPSPTLSAPQRESPQPAPLSLYYVCFETPDGPIWKIGITTKSVAERFSGEPTPKTTIWEKRFDDGCIPAAIERFVVKRYRHLQYKGSILRNGNTECFTADVFNGADIESIVERFDAAG